MKIYLVLLIVLTPFLAESSSDSLELLIDLMSTQLDQCAKSYDFELNNLKETWLRKQGSITAFQMVRYQEMQDSLRRDYNLQLDMIRYEKGIEMIRLIYEKILGLNHHFASLKTHQHVMALANPQSYPGFQKAQEKIMKRVERKFHFAPPAFIQSHPVFSTAFSLVGTLIGARHEKDREFEKIACVLDFTMRMNNELSVIYFETEYLKEASTGLQGKCEDIFAQYMEAVGYRRSLIETRKEDHWEEVHNAMKKYAEYFKQVRDPISLQKRNNIKFVIDRVVYLVDVYSNFIGQGKDYYNKFGKIISGYSNALECSSELAPEYRELKNEINTALETFNAAYQLTEIQGSRLKALMYGNG